MGILVPSAAIALSSTTSAVHAESQQESTTLRVAVVGAGVSGCACSWSLLKKAPGHVSLTLFEMGRGAGGRTATRSSRDVPGMKVNHGAPLFHLRPENTAVIPLVDELLAAGHLAVWNGTAGSVHKSSAVTKRGPASHGEPLDQNGVKRYTGSPTMSSLSNGILQLSGEGLQMQYGTKVSSMQPTPGLGTVEGWTLRSKDGSLLGEFDWLVITSSTNAHLRWQETFGEAPPMTEAAQSAGVAQLSAAVNQLTGIKNQGVHVVMLTWETGGDEPGVVDSLLKLPFDVTQVEGDDVLAKVVRQSLGPQHAVVVLHSTAAFAEKHKKVMGSTGTAARMGAAGSSAAEEDVVAKALVDSFKQLLDRLGAGELAQPSWGPVLHRWGNAFPAGDTEGSTPSLMIPEAHVVFVGDYLAAPYGCVETALSSGIDAAEKILTEAGVKRQEL